MRLWLIFLLATSSICAAVKHKMAVINNTSRAVKIQVELRCNPVVPLVVDRVLDKNSRESVSFDTENSYDTHCFLARFSDGDTNDYISISESRFDGRVCQLLLEEDQDGDLRLNQVGCGSAVSAQPGLSGAFAATLQP